MPNRKAIELAHAHGFTLDSVCWGYRDIFANALQELLDEGAIGEKNRETTAQVFSMLNQADRSCYDHVLKEFLSALNPQTRWLLALPGVFGEVVDLGRRLAEQKIYYGTTFFQLLGSGALGRTPSEMRHLVSICDRLLEHDAEIAVAFARGFERVRDRLTPREIDVFVSRGEALTGRSREATLAFFSCASRAAENVIRTLTQECRLEEVAPQMKAMLRALAGYDVEVDHLGSLDSDELIERGASFICFARSCYVPVAIREFSDVRRNRDWYRLLGVVAAGMLEGRSFPLIHGEPGCNTVSDIAGPDVVRQNLVVVLEYARIVARIRGQWPGAVRLLDFGIRTDRGAHPRSGPASRLFYELTTSTTGHERLRAIIRRSVNVIDTARAVTAEIREQYVQLGAAPMRSVPYLPDFFYPAEISVAPEESLVADLHAEADAAERRREGGDDEHEARGSTHGEGAGEQEEQEAGLAAAFLYDEWDEIRHEYREKYCRLQEHVPDATGSDAIVARVAEQTQRVRRVFERIKPELTRKEKYLQEGDEINPDLLYDYLIDLYHEPSPPVRFYERPRIQRRDLAVLILLDTSGSTSGTHGEQRVIDLEKQATVILSEALHSLDDRFEIGGFSTRGPERCDYYLFKAIGEAWDSEVIRRLDQARPADSTRMGVALRHAGWRLSSVDAKQRLIIVVTDGKPMDDRYSPETRYAQYDVRAACEENERHAIHTFGVSTEENSYTDMEIMFPQHRFAILGDMQDLPRILPRLYVRLTA